MKVTFLGSGTSHGIPAIGCSCDVCRSTDPHNKRKRSSLYVQAGDKHLVIDTPPDFREQVLAYQVSRVDAVLLTHEHADHIFGFDDVRRFCFMQKMRIPVYGAPETLVSMRQKFSYIFQDNIWSASVPQVDFVEVTEAFQIDAIEIEPVFVPHGPMQIYGYVLRHDGRSIGYFPDCSEVDDALIDRLQGLNVMVLDCLRRDPHLTHMHLKSAVDALKQIGAGQSYLTHLSHDLDHHDTVKQLPTGITVAYDGLVLDW